MGKHVVVVVHGVGDPKPGDAIGKFIGGYTISTGATVDGPLVSELRRDSRRPNGKDARLIPMFVLNRGSVTHKHEGTERRTHLYEVHWGDLSRVKGTLLGILEGIVDLVFGLRHVVFAAQRELARAPIAARMGAAAWAVSISSTIALWLVRGPILAFNIVAALVSAMYFSLMSLPPKFGSQINKPLWALVAGSVVGLVLSILLYRMAKKSQWSTSTSEGTIAVSGAALLASAIAQSRYSDVGKVAQDLTFGLSGFSILLAAFILLMLISSFVCLVLLNVRPKLADVFCLAGRQALQVINTCTVLSCTLFVFVVMLMWAVVADSKGFGVPLQKRIVEALHLFGFVWLMLISIGCFYAGLMIRSGWLKRQGDHEFRFPRYIVHPLVVALLLAAGFIASAVFVPLIIRSECVGLLSADHDLCRAISRIVIYESMVDPFEKMDRLAILVSGALASALLAVRAHLGTALDIVLDVIAHFKRAERTAPQALRGQEVDTTYSEWSAMVGRFRDVVKSAISAHSDGDEMPRVTVIAHSQGTMIALEALGVIAIGGGDDDTTELGSEDATAPQIQVELITMGCPLGDLYMHYFPGKYRIRPAEGALVRSWTNIYRADDFVGTFVANPRGSAPASVTFPMNLRVGARGHVNYWVDEEVLKHITRALEPESRARWSYEHGSMLFRRNS